MFIVLQVDYRLTFHSHDFETSPTFNLELTVAVKPAVRTMPVCVDVLNPGAAAVSS